LEYSRQLVSAPLMLTKHTRPLPADSTEPSEPAAPSEPVLDDDEPQAEARNAPIKIARMPMRMAQSLSCGGPRRKAVAPRASRRLGPWYAEAMQPTRRHVLAATTLLAALTTAPRASS